MTQNEDERVIITSIGSKAKIGALDMKWGYKQLFDELGRRLSR